MSGVNNMLGSLLGKKPEKRGSVAKAGGAEALEKQVGAGDKAYSEEGISRRRTEVENNVIAKADAAHDIATALPEKQTPAVRRRAAENGARAPARVIRRARARVTRPRPRAAPPAQLHHVDMYLPKTLEGAIFCGHLVTDLDSVAGAIGAAALYGGTPVCASEINTETQFALEKWKVPTPERVEEYLAREPDVDVCLVDHQQTSQLNPAVNVDKIVGVIDHHALQSKTIVTDKPIYIDIRPWGSMSTIIAHNFLAQGKRPQVPIAGMLLCAILSDTLNLLGPTTTEYDRLMVAVLAEIAGVEDIQLLASDQFKAKSRELAGLSGVALVNGDQKVFGFELPNFSGEIGFAVVEARARAAPLLNPSVHAPAATRPVRHAPSPSRAPRPAPLPSRAARARPTRRSGRSRSLAARAPARARAL